MEVSIVAPEKEVWQGAADMVVARSTEGEFAVLQGHIPFLAALEPGRVVVYRADGKDEYFVHGGFLEASGSSDSYHVIVLADDAERLDDIDVENARRTLEEARRLAEERDDDVHQAHARVAVARVDVVQRGH